MIDFSSWCTNFGWEFSQEIFKDLDDLFGFNMVYQYIHLFHLSSILIFQDRFGPPPQSGHADPVPGKKCIYGPEAWQESLRQKSWKLITIMLIQLAAEICTTTASLLGQGDNQVLLLKIPPAKVLSNKMQTEEEYINNFVNVLTTLADQAGIPIKPLTWRSRHLFEYSRRYHFKGAQVSCALKKMSRLASEANQVIQTLNGDLSGIYSTGTSAASKDECPMNAYRVTIVEAAHTLRRSMPWLRQRPLANSLVLVSNTRTLEGFPVTSYPSFCMRAVQDQLTTGLHWMRTLMRDPIMSPAVSTIIKLRRKQQVDYESLIKDPTSLSLTSPMQSELYLRDMIKQYLPQLIRNRAVKNLFDVAADEEKKNLVTDLSRIRPFNPHLANKLYTLSNFGLQEKYVSKFTGARSIQQATLSVWTSELAVLNSVKSVEKMNSDYLESLSASDHARCVLARSPACGIELAQLLRDEM